jgi:hypothetical protein
MGISERLNYEKEIFHESLTPEAQESSCSPSDGLL